ncbi:unnamed protein product [Mytilus coruscus]|uniref:LRAT domain-containing protein n=1 Tax=Mytilus coruscus TaxID=42192 RepID=A0A6J8EW12_MYTCO|nr:unnamed protein product [Mytilus coruscus]
MRQRDGPLKNFNSVTKGDNISFERNGICRIRYKHHGIVYEKISSKKVDIVHLTGDSVDLMCSSFSSSNAGLAMKVVDIDKGETIYKYTYIDKREDKLNPGDVAHAIRMEGLPSSYNLVNFNCESFAAYCAIGKVVSKQTGRFNKEAEDKLNEIVKKYY